MPAASDHKRGDVVLVLFPHSDLRTAKLRPALIVQADGLDTGLSQVIVAMITSRMARANHPSRVIVKLNTSRGQTSGLLADSVVMTDNLATITEMAIERVIGKLPMPAVDKALKHTLGLRNRIPKLGTEV
jgi:mRNA interferase MazF